MPHLRRFWKGRSDSPAASRAPLGPVFVSHSSRNKKLAEAVVTELESNGIRCWVAPRDIRPGEPNYGAAILDGLDSCRAMVLLLTEPSNASQHVMKESERAVNRKLPILVVRFQPIEVSRELEYYVSSAQFLDATSTPTQEHFPVIRRRVRDMLAPPAKRGRATPSSTPRTSVFSGVHRFGTRLFGVATRILWILAIIMAISAYYFGDAKNSVEQPNPASAPSTAGAGVASQSQGTRSAAIKSQEPAPSSTAGAGEGNASTFPSLKPRGGASALLAGVREKTKIAGSLEALAKSKLANFHREALRVTKNGELETGNVSKSDVEVLASCRIESNKEGYEAIAKALIPLLDKACKDKGTITSDGLRTSERHGHDARPIVEKITQEAIGNRYGVLSIFANQPQRELIESHVNRGKCPFISHPSAFVIYDERATGPYDDLGLDAVGQNWDSLLQQEGTGVVLVLESTKNSFRHTTWRWFHVPPPEWSIITSAVSSRFTCVTTLVDEAEMAVERGDYPLWQYGVVFSGEHGDRVVCLAPFFVHSSFGWYLPEVRLTKAVVVLPGDVQRVKGYTVAIEEVPPTKGD